MEESDVWSVSCPKTKLAICEQPPLLALLLPHPSTLLSLPSQEPRDWDEEEKDVEGSWGVGEKRKLGRQGGKRVLPEF